jgi:hypothetical protein
MLRKTDGSAVVNELLEKAGIQQTEDLHKELKQSRVEKDNDLNTVMDGIKACSNPFSVETRSYLGMYSITTGKEASGSAKQELLNFRQTGEELRDEFRDGCLQDHARFEKSIRRRKLNNFASESVKMIVKNIRT